MKNEVEPNIDDLIDRLSRRRLFQIAAVGSIAGMAWLLRELAIQDHDTGKPYEVYSGIIKVIPKVNLRTDPHLTGKREDPNLISWSSVEEINGIPYDGKSDFEIKNPEIFLGDEGRWVRLRAKYPVLFDSRVRSSFFNVSSFTSDFVTLLDGKFHPVLRIENGEIHTFSGTFQQDSIGKITLLKK